MARKRKRHHAVNDTAIETGLTDLNKRQRVSGDFRNKDPPVKQALLTKYYPSVLCLRDYLLSKLPASSKVRRKKLLSVGRKTSANIESQDGDEDEDEDLILGDFIDKTLIGISSNNGLSQEDRLKEWVSFSQRGDVSVSTIANSSGNDLYSQSEVGVYQQSSNLPSGMFLSRQTTNNLNRLLTLLFGYFFQGQNHQMEDYNTYYVKDIVRILVLVLFIGMKISERLFQESIHSILIVM